MPSTAVAFAAVVGGAIVLDYGVKSIRSATSGGTTGAGVTQPVGKTGSISALMSSIAAGKGWTASDVAAWRNILNAEDPTALTNPTRGLSVTNPSSGAYGYAQFISGPGEYSQYGGNTSTPAGELTAQANYIEQRYKTPSAAWAFHLIHGYY